MFYIIKMKNGNGKLSFEPPINGEYYITTDTLPNGAGALKFDQYNNIYCEALSSSEDSIDKIRTSKLSEIGEACSNTIYSGVVVRDSRFSLTEHDQIELMAQQSAILRGAEYVPYHADGELCRMYSAEEFSEIFDTATAHIFYHRTYCNHINIWINRAQIEELNNITYGAILPNDLAAHMEEIINQVGNFT